MTIFIFLICLQPSFPATVILSFLNNFATSPKVYSFPLLEVHSIIKSGGEVRVKCPAAELRGIQFSKELSSPLPCTILGSGLDGGGLRWPPAQRASGSERGDDKIDSPSPSNPLPPWERGGHSSSQQSWGVFWHILINLTPFLTECNVCWPWPSLNP